MRRNRLRRHGGRKISVPVRQGVEIQMTRLTDKKCGNCGHRHMQYTSTGEWSEAERLRLIYTTGCLECQCMDFEVPDDDVSN